MLLAGFIPCPPVTSRLARRGEARRLGRRCAPLHVVAAISERGARGDLAADGAANPTCRPAAANEQNWARREHGRPAGIKPSPADASRRPSHFAGQRSGGGAIAAQVSPVRFASAAVAGRLQTAASSTSMLAIGKSCSVDFIEAQISAFWRGALSSARRGMPVSAWHRFQV